jgi:hypothetical protein
MLARLGVCGCPARLKNDKVDAAILAQLLRADLLPEAWIASYWTGPGRGWLAELGRADPDGTRLGSQSPARAYLQAGLGVAAVGHEPGRADRQAIPGLRRHLHCHRQEAREEDRHYRDLPQARRADPGSCEEDPEEQSGQPGSARWSPGQVRMPS